MAVTFDPSNRLIIADAGTTSIDVGADMYSRWKDWKLIGDNGKYLSAFETVGGDPTTGGNSIAAYFFLANGWKLRPQEANHTLVIDGILLTTDQSSPYVSTLGTFNVSIQAVVPLQAESILVETGVSGLTASESMQLEEVEGLSYIDATVYIDTVGGVTGNVFPSGNAVAPVNNWADASIIASGRGYSKFNLHGTLTLGAGDFYDKTVWMAHAGGHADIILGGASSDHMSFKGIGLTGAANGRIVAEDCNLKELTGFDGIAEHSVICGDITADSTATELLALLDCKSLVAGTAKPILDINNASCDVNVRGYIGGLTISNFSAGGNASIDVLSGDIELDASCTSGIIVIRGICTLTDNSGAGCIVIKDGIVGEGIVGNTTEEIADAVWEKDISGITTADTAAKILKKKADKKDIIPPFI